MLAGAEVVAGSGNEDLQAVCRIEATCEQIRACFRRRVGVARIERILLREPAVEYLTVDLIGRYLQEPLDVRVPCRIEKRLGTLYVGRHERPRTLYRPVDVGFCSEIDDRVHVLEEIGNEVEVPDITLDEIVTWVFKRAVEVRPGASVG
jgi:hypothetical protein